MCLNVHSAEPLRVVSYNVENLFHPKHDSIAVDSVWVETDDWEWTPDGERRWSYTRYYNKLHHIAKVLTHIGQWEGVDIIGLCEIENAQVVRQLGNTIRRNEYDLVHYESPDRRGIDVALLYRKSRIDTISTSALRVDLGEQTTRDILYACLCVDRRDTLHCLVCHMPSQRGGAAESQWKRDAAKRVLQQTVDSILRRNPEAKIVVMGDMNCAPSQDIGGLNNRMMYFANRGMGTHKWQGQWTCLDQFYTSAVLDTVSEVRIYDAEMIMEEDKKFLGLKPMRTFVGFRYQNGYSDHLPIVMEIHL